MINFRFLVNTKYLKIHKGISIMSWSVTCGQLLNGSVNRFAIQCQFLTVANSDTNGAGSFCSQISL